MNRISKLFPIPWRRPRTGFLTAVASMVSALFVAVPLCPRSAWAAPAPFEQMGSFLGLGGVLSSMVGPGPGGAQRLYVSYTFPSNLDLVAYEPGTGRYRVWPYPDGGAWAMEVGPDGKIYLGTEPNGRVLRLDPQSGRLEDLGRAIPGESYVWQLSLGPDGMIYGATYPGCKLVQVNPASGAMVDLGRMDPVQSYNHSLCAAPDGWVYCGIGSARQDIVAFNPKTRELRGILPDSERVPGFSDVYRGTDGYAWGLCPQCGYRLRDGRGTATNHPDLPMPVNRLKDGTVVEDPRTYPGRKLKIFRLGAGPDGLVYGSGCQPEYLFRCTPSSRNTSNLGLLTDGEAFALVPAQGRLYIASYPHATLQIYDPGKPFHIGRTPSDNPYNLDSIAPGQDRPYDMVRAADGRIYAACVPGYGRVGGAIAWYDPATGTSGHAATPVPDQAIASVCALPDGNLVFGTSIEAGPGAQSRAKEAVLFLWDPRRQKKVWEAVPLPGVRMIMNLARGGDGLVYGATDSTLFAFDPKGAQEVGRTRLSEGAVTPAGLISLEDGRVVALAGNSAVLVGCRKGEWKIEDFAVNRLPLTTGKAVVDGWLYAAADTNLVRCRIPVK